MSYVDNNLMSGEAVIQKAKLHWFIYVPGALIILISLPSLNEEGGGILLFIGLLMLFFSWLNAISTELAVTNKRVIAKKGFISRKTVELNLSKVESLNVDQGLFGRIFNFGKIIVHGTGGGKTPFKFIADPLQLRKAVNEQFELQNNQ